MSSSNPFRKKASDAASSSPVKSSLRIDPYPLGHDSTPGRPKPVKKVRVLSPPPLSPDSPEWPVANAAASPFTNGVIDTDIHIATTLARDNGATLVNPFSKPRQQADGSDREGLSLQRRNEGEALKAGNSGRQSLNVDSFRRLLMTGKTTDSDGHFDETVVLAAQSAIAGQGGMEEVGAELKYDQPVSKTASNRHDAKDRKSLALPLPPPPPPSSRHGKSLRQDGSGNSKPGTFSDIKKPLPPFPARQTVADEIESPFDGEQVGGDSEDDTESPTATETYFKKPAPLPPPRKSHSKTGSQSQNGDAADQTSPRSQNAESLKATPADEMGLQSEVSRPATQAPAPPPPRRPHAVSKTSTQTSSQELQPSGKARATSAPGRQYEANFEETNPPAAVSSLSASGKLATPPRPPPPPARNSSVRRHKSSNSIDSVSRRGSASAALAQPPPPPPRPLPRPRGSSGSSVDVADPSKNMDTGKNVESGLAGAGSTKSTAVTGAPGESSSDPSKAFDILADLDALQREVDALRGKLG
ncbi:hypothetical protein CDD82_1881 [Ophiocordyceps australis]|uniref:Uncharacterized protein n=1 Tax=Ophiocordyceps australis TaxID=1399860 RepID=A0A2C5XX69_9HYPO|nr:hypothetical protein CDD82_1881 [Ophiocordyceps australis]